MRILCQTFEWPAGQSFYRAYLQSTELELRTRPKRQEDAMLRKLALYLRKRRLDPINSG